MMILQSCKHSVFWLAQFFYGYCVSVRTVCASEELENGRGNVLRPKTDE